MQNYIVHLTSTIVHELSKAEAGQLQGLSISHQCIGVLTSLSKKQFSVFVAAFGRRRNVSLKQKDSQDYTVTEGHQILWNFCMCSTLQCTEALYLQEITLWFWSGEKEACLSDLSR